MPPTKPVDTGIGEPLTDHLLHKGTATALHGARRLAALPAAAWTLLRLPAGRRDDPPAWQPLRRHARVLMRALRRRLVAGNRFELLIDGPATYAAMFDAIAAAREHIHLESYIVEAEGPGAELAQRLLAKAREGVRIHLLYDGFGSRGTRSSYFQLLRDAGVQVCEYNPLRSWGSLLSRSVHLRDHRKLLVVDGRVAFLGGVNISGVYSAGSSSEQARHANDAKPPPPWRDTHVRIAGPLVGDLQALFVDHWNRHARERIVEDDRPKPLPSVGPHRAAIACCEAGRRRNPFYRALLRAIDAAQQRVMLTTAYFVPTRRLLRALAAAARRGVDVQLVLPSRSDAWAPLHAGRSHYGRLLQAGVRVFEREGALLHAKTAVIDGVWAAVGSANLDWRSFVHNAEANAIVLDGGFGAEMEAVFRRDVAASREVTLEEWHRRGWFQRMREALARRFEFLL
ncbi:phospholipase D-like domain-containing protein [Piscinibacter sp. XHJ-5]|uniref:phospholipase D-like domain-containing protein n=1 Tax=Piscinibacter sp. XHJ-5 TaxID=3037797 RepID=UPI002452EC3E|nr:phospholipase D-like domain-containing protein [Piscinibacter sp. XHJ-5]